MIEARREGLGSRLRETWKTRRLIPYFGRIFVRRRFIRTFLGPIWLFLRPGMMILSQLFVFGGVLAVSTGGTPYLIFFLITFSAWTIFRESAYISTRSLEVNRSILRRLYIPRGPILLGAAAPAFVDYLIVLGFLGVGLGFYVISEGTFYLDVSSQMLLLVPALGMLLAWGLTVGLWLAVPGAQYRDVRFSLSSALRFWYFFTPVAYPASTVPDNLRLITELNPLTAPIGLAKYALLSEGPPTTMSLIISLAGLSVFASVGAMIYFRSESAALDHL